MDLLQQVGERVMIFEARRAGPLRERTAQRGSNADLVKHRIDTDNSTFHAVLAGILCC